MVKRGHLKTQAALRSRDAELEPVTVEPMVHENCVLRSRKARAVRLHRILFGELAISSESGKVSYAIYDGTVG